MTTRIDALKMALEALDQLTNVADTFSVSGVYLNEEVWAKKCLSDAYFAITTIEEALAQQSNEQGCEHCNHSLYCGTKCKNCGKQSNEQVEPARSEAYDMVDRFLRNSMHDEGYADYSKALDLIYTHPPVPTAQPKEPEQEPVAWVYPEFWEHLKSVHCGTAYAFDGSGPNSDVERQPLYTTPPQRKPLTDEQRRAIAFRWRDGNGTASEIIDMVEAAHGIKE